MLLGLAAAFTVSGAMAQSLPPEGFPDHGAGKEHAAQHAITRAQALERAAKRFDRADTNKDGVLSVEERRAAFEHRRHRGHHGQPPEGQDGPPRH
jgi:hypothetical protein